MFLYTKVLLPENDAIEDLGLTSPEMWVDFAIDMECISTFMDYIDDKDEIDGSIIYTYSGMEYIVKAPFNTIKASLISHQKHKTKEASKNGMYISFN